MFYNRMRRHSAKGYVCPNEYEQQYKPLTVSTIRGQDQALENTHA